MGKTAQPDFRVWLYGPMKVEKRREHDVYEEVPIAAWQGRMLPRRLLKTLLLQPNRRASRAFLVQTLCPGMSVRRMSDDLSKALRLLRRVLTTEGESLVVTEPGRFYCLAEEDRIWVDVDASIDILNQAERLGRTSPDALPLLERALGFFQRGTLLEGEEWPWIQREKVNDASYRCCFWLAEAYAQQEMYGQSRTILSKLLQDDPGNVDVLARLLKLLIQQEMSYQAQRLYQQTKERVSEHQIARVVAIGQQLSLE